MMRCNVILGAAFKLSIAIAAAILQPGPQDSADKSKVESPPTSIDTQRVLLTMADGSKLNVRLADDPIEILTPYGTISVPAGDVRRMVVAARLTEEDRSRIASLIESLGDPDLNDREQAANELLALQARAWQPLQRASEDSSPEIAKEAEALLDKLWDIIPENELARSELDVVETPDSKIVGRISTDSIRIQTTQFGELQLKLTDARSLHSLAFSQVEAEEDGLADNAQPDPGNLKALESQIGAIFQFQVTGAGGATLWGSNPYTTDSRLASAVVHCGLLKQGQTGIVRIKILGDLPSYLGSSANGLSSNNYGDYPGYLISKPKKPRPRR